MVSLTYFCLEVTDLINLQKYYSLIGLQSLLSCCHQEAIFRNKLREHTILRGYHRYHYLYHNFSRHHLY